METEHCVFVEEGPCETVSTDITVEGIASTVDEIELHAADSAVVNYLFFVNRTVLPPFPYIKERLIIVRHDMKLC